MSIEALDGGASLLQKEEKIVSPSLKRGMMTFPFGRLRLPFIQISDGRGHAFFSPGLSKALMVFAGLPATQV